MTFTFLNLTIGQEYFVQIWTNDSREGISGFLQTYTARNTSEGANTNVAGEGGGVGQFVTGSFVANASGQVITLDAQGPLVLVYTALQLQAVPEPTVVPMLVLGGVALGLSRRISRRRSGSES